jgi:hypothetical protein
MICFEVQVYNNATRTWECVAAFWNQDKANAYAYHANHNPGEEHRVVETTWAEYKCAI